MHFSKKDGVWVVRSFCASSLIQLDTQYTQFVFRNVRIVNNYSYNLYVVFPY